MGWSGATGLGQVKYVGWPCAAEIGLAKCVGWPVAAEIGEDKCVSWPGAAELDLVNVVISTKLEFSFFRIGISLQRIK